MLVQNGMAQIQVQQPNNTWRGVKNVSAEPFYYIKQMEQVKRQYPDRKVRIVDSANRLLDLIP